MELYYRAVELCRVLDMIGPNCGKVLNDKSPVFLLWICPVQWPWSISTYIGLFTPNFWQSRIPYGYALQTFLMLEGIKPLCRTGSRPIWV